MLELLLVFQVELVSSWGFSFKDIRGDFFERPAHLPGIAHSLAGHQRDALERTQQNPGGGCRDITFSHRKHKTRPPFAASHQITKKKIKKKYNSVFLQQVLPISAFHSGSGSKYQLSYTKSRGRAQEMFPGPQVSTNLLWLLLFQLRDNHKSV